MIAPTPPSDSLGLGPADPSVDNVNAYRSKSAVDLYQGWGFLQAPEQTILDLLMDRLGPMTMLDIGVGGGRTTTYFADRVSEYVGVDVSEEMIEACHQRFKELPANVSFAVADARDMSQFSDGRFDLVLFSYNGIDHVSHADRLRVLREIRRVSRPGASFVFSSHNILGLHRLFGLRYQFAPGVRTTLRNIKRWYLLNYVHNPSLRYSVAKRSNHAIVNDGGHDYGLRLYYVHPDEQLRQLQEHFRDVRVFSVADGHEIVGPEGLRAADDLWLYYLCTAK